MNYFELFSLPTSYEIDSDQLADHYRDLQRTVHPDKFAHASEQDKRLSVQRTAQINDGFTTLKDPIWRAEHILTLNGLDLSHESTTIKDTGFLMQQMEWRESIELIATSRDNPDVDEMIATLYDSFEHFRDLLQSELSSLLQQLQPDEKQLKLAADLIRKLKFMAKLQSELEQLEDKLLE